MALNYSAVDRAIHRLAFSSRALQFTAADVEKLLFAARFRDIPVVSPIFITSLPRAGTTLLLEILSSAPALATHTYRDMPFVTAPVLWSAMLSRFRKQAELRERAHGDGMRVGYDSPEAFEEVIWRAFWPRKFNREVIHPWSVDDRDEGFEDFFVEHIRRVIAARSSVDAPRARYVSKNNANIARRGLLKRLFKDALIVVPFRAPVEQAKSLLRQHLRFLEVHRKDRFSRRYMRDLGHFEFGELHQPIAFEGVESVRSRFDPDSLDYWIGYWVSAFREVLKGRDQVILLSYERLCSRGLTALHALEHELDLAPGSLASGGVPLRPPARSENSSIGLDSEYARTADALHRQLLELSVI